MDIALPKGKLELLQRLPRASAKCSNGILTSSLGRTLHACQIAFEEMRRQQSQQPGPTRPYPSTTYVNIAPAAPVVAPGRSFSAQLDVDPTRRPLQPRPSLRATESPNPPVSNGESPIYMRNTALDSAPEPTKKRGRPSKEEAAERDRKLALEGKTYQPKKRPAKRMRPSLPADFPSFKDEESTTPLIQTPTARAPEPVEQTSSGKRRSRRQTRDESPSPSGGTAVREREAEREPEPRMAESPSDRLLASHRNRDRDSAGSSLSRRTQQESDILEHSILESDYTT
ncbi:hypothetical protein PMZ80_006601 [Knufia obscura]|uniref:Uncharacterized protein n=2 Tax=Knufia TaxID=430999 RepID=A0AAN8I5D6_9EURO|nr:hypothetical protein PMZ80_006601 [Knufia obscura]KAK5950960.1 hypothetical protein OHC33_008032 [Knufia fluminis]